MMPPIRETKQSRLRFFDIVPELDTVRNFNSSTGIRGTAWIPEAVKVDRCGWFGLRLAGHCCHPC